MTKQQAQTEAKQCLSKMTTKGWKIHVHENLGWHWCLENIKGHFTLHKSGDHHWTLLSDGDHSHCGSVQWSTGAAKFLNPNIAVSYQIEVAKRYAGKVSGWVASVEQRITPKRK